MVIVSLYTSRKTFKDIFPIDRSFCTIYLKDYLPDWKGSLNNKCFSYRSKKILFFNQVTSALPGVSYQTVQLTLAPDFASFFMKINGHLDSAKMTLNVCQKPNEQLRMISSYRNLVTKYVLLPNRETLSQSFYSEKASTTFGELLEVITTCDGFFRSMKNTNQKNTFKTLQVEICPPNFHKITTSKVGSTLFLRKFTLITPWGKKGRSTNSHKFVSTHRMAVGFSKGYS